MTIELDSTIAQAEVLFLSFRQLVEDVDRRQREKDSGVEGLRQRKANAAASTGANVGSTSGSRSPLISESLRALLVSGVQKV